jgi:CRP/FNR family transcriptional regulator, cyclic AMP receptor protein
VPPNKKLDFAPRKFLATIGVGRKIAAFSKKQTIFTQGDAADAVFYIQQDKVRLTVVSQIGKEATLGILSEGEFFGRRWFGWPVLPHGVRNRNDGLRTSEN